MKKQRGRPRSLLARVSASGATRRDIRKTILAILHGSRAWRFIILRQLPLDSAQRAKPVVRFRKKLLQQFENALVTGDDDFFNDLAKAIRGEAQPEPFAMFTIKVLVLLEHKAGATASDIFADEYLKKEYLDKMPNGRPDLQGQLKVEDRKFEKKQRALDAIHDIAKKVKHELARKGRWVGSQKGNKVGFAG